MVWLTPSSILLITLIYSFKTWLHINAFELNDVNHLIKSCNEDGAANILNSEEDTSSSCSCDSKCVSFGDCCLDKLSELGISKLDYISCRGNARRDFFTYVKNTCKESWNDSFVRNLCEGTNYSSLGNITLSSIFTGVTYSNMFCSICNDELDQDMDFWISEFKCETNLLESDVTKILHSIYKSISEGVITNDIELIECDLSFKFPSLQLSRYLRKCQPSIAYCSDRWQNNQVLEKCLAYTSLVVGVSENKTAVDIYRNPHCALCNWVNVDNIHHLDDLSEILGEKNKYKIDFNLIKLNDLKQGRLINDSTFEKSIMNDSSSKELSILFPNIKLFPILNKTESSDNEISLNITGEFNCGPFQVSIGDECIDFDIPMEDSNLNNTAQNETELEFECEEGQIYTHGICKNYIAN